MRRLTKIIVFLCIAFVITMTAGCGVTSDDIRETAEASVSEDEPKTEPASDPVDSETESVPDSTTADTITGSDGLNMSIDEAAEAVFNACGVEPGDMNEETAGIWVPVEQEVFFDESVLDYRIWRRVDVYEDEDGSSAEYNNAFFILEFDTESEYYKALTVGGEIDVYPTKERVDDPYACIFVTAINGQYALYINESAPKSLPDWHNYTSPFDDREIQSLYNAFITLG